MVSDDILENLPTDDEDVFLVIENEYRKLLDARLESQDANAPWQEYYQAYIVGVMAAATECKILEIAERSPPTHSDSSYADFREFMLLVEQVVLRIRIRRARIKQGSTIALDQAARARILVNVQGLRDAIKELDVTDLKRAAIEKRLNKFVSEVNSGKTILESFGAIIVWFGGVIGQSAEKAEPARKFLDSISNLLDKATDYNKSLVELPSPSKPKQIEPPKKSKSPDIDEDIPF